MGKVAEAGWGGGTQEIRGLTRSVRMTICEVDGIELCIERFEDITIEGIMDLLKVVL